MSSVPRAEEQGVEPAPPTRVCVGTSCFLRGAGRLRESLREAAPVETVQCLGFCDHSPVVMDVSGTVHTRSASGRLNDVMRQAAPGAVTSRVRTYGTEPIVTRRIGAGDFSNLSKATRDGAYRALERALHRPATEIIDTLEASGERGRGGAHFPTAAKWRAAAQAPTGPRVVVANGDEGDPGSFIDRLLMERDPHGILEGLALAAVATGAHEGIVYIRREYPRAIERMKQAIEEAQEGGYLGPASCGTSFALHVRVEKGLGRYVCGEETVLLNAVEGRRAEARLRPPYPTERGLWNRPTVVNNVETLVNVPWILERGAAAYAAIGTTRSRGTKALCLSAGFAAPGVVEVPFGVSLRDVIQDAGATACDETAFSSVLLGGPMGTLLRPDQCDVPICHGAMRDRGIHLGHGGLVAVPPDARPQRLLLSLLHFAHTESCGKCLPCREGSRRALELFSEEGVAATSELEAILSLMESTSLCGFGRGVPGPLRTLLRQLPGGGDAA